MCDENISDKSVQSNKRVLLTLSADEYALLSDAAEYCGVPVATLIRKFLAEFGGFLSLTVSDLRRMDELGLSNRHYINSIVGSCFSITSDEEAFEAFVEKQTAMAYFVTDLKKG